VTDHTERIPPQDLDAERSMLGSMMLDRERVGDVIAIFGREDTRWLYGGGHAVIFNALLDLYDAGKPIDIVTLRDHLQHLPDDQFEKAGGVDYLVRCAESVPTAVNAEHYARIVRDYGLLRDLIGATHQIQSDAYDAVDDAAAILDNAEQRMFAVTERRVAGDAVRIGDVARAVLEDLERSERGSITGLRSGYYRLDDLTTGFQAGDLIIVGGRASMGKTALGLNMAGHFALHEQTPVLFLSMEMSAKQVTQRILCSTAGVDAQMVRKHMHNEGEAQQLREAQRRLDDAALILVDDTPSPSPTEVRAKARRYKARHGIGAVVVDYLQLMRAKGYQSREQEIAHISRSLKALGRELGIPIIAMAQLNRATEDSADKRPSLRNLRESGAIEQDADVVLLLHRPGYYKRDDPEIKHDAVLIVAKQRNGPIGDIELHFDDRTTTFHSRAVHSESAEYAPPIDQADRVQNDAAELF
jgi:replicative DNA helicase